LIFEGRVAGIEFNDIWDWTWGEVLEFIRVVQERKRRENQDKAYIAFKEADLISGWIFEKKEMSVVEAFPTFWTSEEREEILKQAKIEKYKNIMFRYANKR
jgi:hypothetical protein